MCTDLSGRPLIFSSSYRIKASFSYFPSALQVPATEVEAYRMKTLNPNFRGGVIASMDEVVYHNRLNIKNFTFRVMKEEVFMAQVAILFQKNSYLKDAFDQKMKLLKSNGLINYWISQYIDYSYSRVKKTNKAPEKLNVQQLVGGFKICFYGLCIATISFILELLVYASRTKLCNCKWFTF